MQVGFLVFPQVTQLDLMGPLQVLSRIHGATMHGAAASVQPVPTDCGVAVVPTCTFATAPTLDVLCVPGGFGVRQVQDAYAAGLDSSSALLDGLVP